MSWRVMVWGAVAVVCVALAGSLWFATGVIRGLGKAGGRQAWRALAIVLSVTVASGCLYALWFAWPMFTGRRPAPKDPALARALGEPVTHGGLSVLAVVAHPDDAEWYCGGTLARTVAAGSKVTVIVATDGERGRGAPSSGELAAIRRREQQEAARIMGYTRTVFLEIPDRGVSRADDLKGRIAAVWDEVKPDIVLTFDAESPSRPYVHPDHQAVGHAVLSILHEKREKPATAYLFSSAEPNAVVDITQLVDRKLAAIHAHRTQFGRTGGRGAVDQNYAAGESSGLEYAEMFRVVQPLP
ncbi:MAG: PIG-L family deacetylase [Firmicutes bacterium]|nr:PIG-L family deacetylase [Bacillota bacterium]